MPQSTLTSAAEQLVKRCEAASPSERLTLRPEVNRVVRTLKSQQLPVPKDLGFLKARLEDEAYDDMFDNMPV